MPVMRIDGRMHHAGVPLSYIGPDGQHLDIEAEFCLWVVATHLNVMALGYKRCDVCEKHGEKLIWIGEVYKYV